MKLIVISFIAFCMIMMIISCQSDQKIEFNRFYASGNVVYKSKCQNCHGANGEGLQSLIPPLNDSIYLKKNKNSLACMVKYGVKGKFLILNRQFEGEMPASDLAPVEVAEVLTYINNSFGNRMGIYNMQQAGDDLLKCR